MPTSHELIRSTIATYGQTVDPDISRKISIYMDLIELWNRKISLTAVTDPQDILRFHFGESIYPLQFLGFERGRLADVGSGSGFPGLAIKIFRPDLEIVLIEPNKRKCAFLAEVARSLKLSSVEIISKPFKESGVPPKSLQFVTSRALAKFENLLSWSDACIIPGGAVVLWVSAQAASQIQRFTGFHWSPARIMSGTQNRAILIGQKQT
jgi:16S rRNA (guanine527-N7)-methyltransferase